MDNQIYNIINDMSEVLNVAQMKRLQEVLIERLVTQQARPEESDNAEYLDMFLTAKRIEGCSERTLEYYRSTIKMMLDKIDGCNEMRDLAMIDLLASTGIRVGELVNLDIADLNFEERVCIVYGRGDKERKVYFDARTKLHIQKYMETRNDDNPALFVSLNAPYQRLQISGVEIRLRELGRHFEICNVHPHKFRRTMATRAIDKGMPIEQVQKLLGHQQIDTTMQYAMVNQSNVKSSHRKYIA